MIPLHVLTGFLGAGKTTLLARLLQEPAAERTAVLVNEIGDLALDHHLLERIDDDVVALPSGCICCTMRGEMHAALERVLALCPARIVLETTGLADPAPILHALAIDARLRPAIRVASVVTVVDVERAEELLAEHDEVRRQLELADRVVLTKVDRAPQRLAAVRALVAAAAPGCELREAVDGCVDVAWLLTGPRLARLDDAASVRLWLHHGESGSGVRTHAVQRTAPAQVELVHLWQRLVTQLDGHRLLRSKALVECAASGDVFALQSAGHAVSPPRRLAHRPPAVRGVQMVLIERGLGDAAVRQLLATLDEALRGTRRR
ncbi:MAG: GTP-binding protein [Planctomycetes bacterium]|nr:GTP-binding protein [Planctomycetota bacterium]